MASRGRTRLTAAAVLAVTLTASCTGGRPGTGASTPPPPADASDRPTPPSGSAPTDTAPAGTAPTSTAPTSTAPTGTAPTGTAPTGAAPTGVAPTPTSDASTPPRFDAEEAMGLVRDLALTIGPREAASPQYRRAADLVGGRLSDLGYEVSRLRTPVPEGVSWGVPVGAGSTVTLLATTEGYRPDRPHRVVGAHLDTVPQAPGAEDNASGVAVLLQLARMAAQAPPRVPVRFAVFGGEEPRGPGDDLHHFGSRDLVAGLTPAQRDNVVGMVSLDRVGVDSPEVPVCYGGLGSARAREQVLDAARRVDVPAARCVNRASDHWSFEKAGIAAARIGSVPYAGYHSPADRPGVVDADRLRRVGRIAWAWLNPP